MKNILLLASKSPSRQMLLREASIPFRVIEQDADESQCDWGLSFSQVVSRIAHYKMEHAILPVGNTVGDRCFVLTADTLSSDANGVIHGKPTDRADAILKIKAARAGSLLCTAFCLDRRSWDGSTWHVDERIEQVVEVRYVFDIPDTWIDIYLNHTIAQQCAGAIAVEGFGSQFLQSVEGSHSAIIGLPLFEVRKTLEKLEFFDNLFTF